MNFDVDRMVLNATTTIAGYNMVSQVLPTGQSLAAYFDKPKIFNELLSIHQAINFDLVGENQQITVQTLTKTTEYRVGLNISEGLGKPGKRVSLSLFNNGANLKFVIAFESPMGKRWSKPFQIQDVGKVYVRVEDLLNSEMLVHVEILLQGPSIFIKLKLNADKWPFLIRNKSSFVLHFGQTSQPDSEMSYAWDEPAEGLESLIQVISLQRRDQGQSSFKPLPPVLLREHIVISFERQESADVAERTFDSCNPLYFLLNAVTMAIGTISGAPLTLNQLKVENARISQGQLMTRLIQHYQSKELSQLYRVIASADFLSNPAGLFNSVSSGVQDLFYEPLNGVVLHGTSELGIGIAQGAASLVKKSAFGVTDSVSKITGSVSKGPSAAALDSNWARKRQRRQVLNRNKVNCLVTGTSAFVGSLASDIFGIAMKPIEGAVGFLKGLGKGLVGIIEKPAVGTFDFLSNVSGGLRNATTVFDPSHAGRTRLPRHIAHDGILKPYNIREAQGQDCLRSVGNGKLHSCKYVAHIELPNDVDSVCILTTTRVVMIHTSKLKIVWQIELSELK
ncbi:hypothetical protein O181_081717 [Austropuccinia psidii MF-1]|uniref:Vacuolar protein sorting-associated protein 13 DH-like domain-containing protein n=1 Tax=Austropuccinia psidii MF-1 TaxID=1389203 RepID=A0A9Q3FP44_9BASI|nr:hypothetical protein [Austropuccinia psidii MF-1]